MNTIEIKTEMWDNVLVRLIDDNNVDGFCTDCDCWLDISRFQNINGFCQPCKDCYVGEEWEAGFEDDEDEEDDLKYSNSEDEDDKTNEKLMTQIDVNNKRIRELKEEDNRRDAEIEILTNLLIAKEALCILCSDGNGIIVCYDCVEKIWLKTIK